MKNLFKYEFRKTLLTKLIILGITIVAQAVYLFGIWSKDRETTVVVGMLLLFFPVDRRTSFPEVRVKFCDSFALLCPLDDHISLKLREGQQHIPHEGAHAVVAEDSEVQDIHSNAPVDQLSDKSACL